MSESLTSKTLTNWVRFLLALAIDHDDDGVYIIITFDKYGPDRLDNSFPSGGTLSSGASF